MKRLIISLAAISALISCTQEYRPQPDPYVAAQGTCVFKAQIELLQGSWVWNSATDKVGIYADNLTNASFLPRVAYNGKEGVIELMGEGALGQAYAYFPYSPDGDGPTAALWPADLPDRQCRADTPEHHTRYRGR